MLAVGPVSRMVLTFRLLWIEWIQEVATDTDSTVVNKPEQEVPFATRGRVTTS